MKHTRDQTNAIKAKAKPIYCLTNSTAYTSITEAARQLKLKESAIINVCKGRINDTNGYRFEYLAK